MKSINAAAAQCHSFVANPSNELKGTEVPPTHGNPPRPIPDHKGASPADVWTVLEQSDQVPAFFDDALCQKAANLLLSLGHTRLLCRLAERRPIAYVLDIGASEQKACTLGSIGGAWPRHTPVSVVLAASLSAKAAHALDAFLPYPTTLVLRVVADGLMNTSEAEAKALEALVKGSGATALDVTDASIAPLLAVRLLACRDRWAAVHVLYTGTDSVVHQQLAKGQQQIDRLELHLPEGSSFLTPDSALLRMLMATGVRTLVVHGPLDLFVLAVIMQSTSGPDDHLLEFHLHRLEACFVVSEHADVGWTMASLFRTRGIDELQHKPMPVERAGYTPIDADAACRLASRSSSKRMALAAAEGAANRHRLAAESRRFDVSKEWSDAARAIGALLAPDQSLLALRRYVQSPANTLVPKKTAFNVALADPRSLLLNDKLRELISIGAPHALLRAALALHLENADAEELDSVCKTLILMQFPLLPLRPEAWQALSRGFKVRWLSERLGPTELSTVSPPADADRAAEPPRGEHKPRALTMPSGGVAELLVPRGEAARVAWLERVSQLPRDAATTAVVRLLVTGRCAIARMDDEQQLAFTNLLLREGQWKLLAHMVPTRPRWVLQALTPHAASMLEQMKPWPSATSACHIVLSSSLSAPCIQQVSKLANSVPGGRLSLAIDLGSRGRADGWDHLAKLVNASRCRDLTFIESSPDAAPATLVGFFNSIQAEQLEHLSIQRFGDRSPQLTGALVGFVRRTSVHELNIGACSEAITQALVTCRPWHVLSAEMSSTLAHALRKGGATVRELYLLGTSFDDMRRVAPMVKSIAGLKKLHVLGAPMNLTTLAEVLNAQPSIESVDSRLSMTSSKQAAEAIALIRQHTAFRHIDSRPWKAGQNEFGGAPLDEPTWEALTALTFRSALRYPKAFSVGAGGGFGASLGDGARLGLGGSPSFQRGVRPFTDPGKIIGSLLDPRSAQALSITSKTAYMASSQPWEKHIDALAGLLVPAVDMGAVLDYLAVLGKTVTLDDTEDDRSADKGTQDDQMLEKVVNMWARGVPLTVLAEAIGRGLVHSLAPTERLLEVLAFLGVMPSRQWLTTGLGIDVVAPSSIGPQ
ncbi:hypothetical protein [Hydrogenophaga sp.]|uniref:hypothetical protein n=1 Tax=Hydrogenophaga sp. TaxID=1904254 RepID=UPI00271671BB|nr:hypothetical protein [Hydrogenophaga sp.]MDO9438227.1 hypothetical protein [Hydrogenophaga sp.]